MIQIVLKSPHQSLFWYKDKPALSNIEIDRVSLICASGPELGYVLEKFSNIPKCETSPVCWRNPFAAFIVEHLWC